MKEKAKQQIKLDISLQLRQMKKHRTHYLMMLPYALLFATITLAPVVIAIVFSFTSFNIFEPPSFVGFHNYFKLFLSDDIFMIAVKNTLMFAVIIGPVSYMMALMLAWMINDLSRPLRVTFTVLFYAPSLSGGMTVIWNYLFTGDAKGFINGQLMKLGLIQSPINFLQDAKYMAGIMIIILLWMSLGATFLSFIAGLQGVDKQYYEAGALDGIKNRWQELWFITLPMMKPQLLFGAVMNITSAFGIGDVITQTVGFPSVDYAVHTMMNHLSDYGSIRYEMGYACAIATILFAMMILSNKAVQRMIRKVGE